MSKALFIPKCLESSKILVSTCQNVFRNLALEDWIYKNIQFDDKKAKRGFPELFVIWKNDPCVVIGRHQNTWSEVNINQALKNKVDVARRRSGGGTVYHDSGNLNLSFFTSRQNYNRKRNLNFVASHLKKEFNVDVEVNKRDDIILNNTFKISGTAAKLGSKIAYHHFTLLVDANLNQARKLLHVSKEGIISKATSSIPSPIANLTEFRPKVTTESLINSIMKSYSFPDDVKLDDIWVDPTDENRFPGVTEMADELQQWSWIYGHSPKFTVERDITPVGIHAPINLKFEVDKGIISKVWIDTEDSEFHSKYSKFVPEAIKDLHGVRYWTEDLEQILAQVPQDTSMDNIWLTRRLMKSIIESLQ